MFDNELIALVIETIIACEASAGIGNTPVKQAFQSTNQGINTVPTAYLYKVTDRRVGYPYKKDTVERTTITTESGFGLVTESGESLVTATISTVMKHTETQAYETTFQISTLATQNPATPTQYTASDILNLIAHILQSDAAIAMLRARNVGIERVSDIRNPYFVDDRQRHEAEPSFDFKLTHQQTIVTTTPAISRTIIQVLTV